MILLELELEFEIRRWEQIQNGFYGRIRKVKDQHRKKASQNIHRRQVGKKIDFVNQSINHKIKHNEKNFIHSINFILHNSKRPV